jgi:hypothetical protein
MLAGGTVLNASVSYSGNGGNAFARSDLDFDGAIDVADWSVFVANNYVSLAGLSPAQSYALGDLDGDGDNDVADFRLFKSDFNSANGAGAFEAQVLDVPEPGSLRLVAALTVAWLAAFRRRRRRYLAMLFAVTFAAADGSREATAAIAHRYSFTSNANDSVGTAHGTVVDMGAPTAVFANGQLDLSANAGQASNAITEDAYVDLPNGVISTAFQSGTLRAATFETWVTVATHRNWAEIYAFGTSNCGEGMSCSGSDTDYITLIPANGAGSGTLWTVGHPAFGGDAPADANVMLPTGVQQHILSVFDHNNTTAGPNGTITQYLNGRLAGTTAIHPNLQLNTMVDNNNWLGRSQWPDPLFDGSFNEFRIYDHALSATEVATSTFFGPDTLNPGELLSVSVNKNTGAISMTNNAAIPVNVDFYRLASPGMALSLVGWNSLDDQNYDAVDGGDAGSVAGDSDGEGWDEAGGSNASQLVEFFLGESGSTIAPSETLNLGNAFNTSVFGPGNNGDLTFTFGLVGGLQITGNVNYVSGPAGVLGDYNNNGSVDAADYVLWRNGGPLQNEGVTPNSTTPEDFNFWRARFGANSGSAAASSAAVPEPVALSLAVVLACVAFVARRRL